jgi:hypothetical protein
MSDSGDFDFTTIAKKRCVGAKLGAIAGDVQLQPLSIRQVVDVQLQSLRMRPVPLHHGKVRQREFGDQAKGRVDTTGEKRKGLSSREKTARMREARAVRRTRLVQDRGNTAVSLIMEKLLEERPISRRGMIDVRKCLRFTRIGAVGWITWLFREYL